MALELRKLRNKSNLNESGAGEKEKTVSKENLHKIFETNSSFHIK